MSGWVNSNDRLPINSDTWCLVVVAGHVQERFLAYSGEKWEKLSEGRRVDYPIPVDHWMPLPSPPEQPKESK